MKKKIAKITLTITLVSLLLNIAGCGKKEETAFETESKIKTIKIAYLPITHALPLFVENEFPDEKFKNVKIELIKFGSWTELADALNAGKVDGASMLMELAMKAKEQGIDLKTVALGHRDGNVVVVSKDINRAADLKGKTFAIPSRLSTQNVLLHIMLKNNGLSDSDVSVVELPPAEMPAALSEGRISGYSVAEPFGAKSVANGNGKTLFESQELWADSVCCGLVLRDDFIKNNTAAVDEFVKGYAEAGQKAELKDSEVGNITSKYLKVELKVLDLSLKWISYKNLKLEEKDYNELSKYLIEMGLLKKPPKFSEFVDNTFMDKVK